MTASNGQMLVRDRQSLRVARLSAAPYPPAPFACDVFPEGRRVRLAPIGELDLASTPKLERTVRELLELGFDDLTIDLRQVSSADARALRLILDLDAARRAGDLSLTLLRGPDETQRIFEVTGTLGRLPFRNQTEPW
ncbi:MAG: anti-sigma-factor antagonist [Solirubrobacterales bacterium]|jgi:anti-anti-sigma factor|nr:anti-sigma-factor antagonist [Solirubrobacterales bacterium]